MKNYENKEKPEKKPCTCCAIMGYKTRYPPKSECWFKKIKINGQVRKSHINLINNSEIEAELQDINEKN